MLSIQTSLKICRLVKCKEPPKRRLIVWCLRPFSAVFLFIVVASAPNHAFLEFFQPVLHTIFFPRHWLLSHIVETMDSSERGMNPVAMTIINPQKECWPSWQ